MDLDAEWNSEPEASNKYCVLCGVILLHEEFEDVPESRRPWYEEARAAVKDHNFPTDQNYFLSNTGILPTCDTLFIPMGDEDDYTKADTFDEVSLAPRARADLSGYAFHDSCWMLLQDRLWDIIEPDEIAESLHDLFYCTPHPDLSTFRLGHDYGGAAETHKPFGEPEPVDLLSPFYADPYMIPAPEKIEENAPDVPVQWRNGSLGPSTVANPGYNSSLGKLSLDVIHDIITYLPLEQVINLRLTCRDLAQRIAFHCLPQSFWKRQFRLGYAMDFVFVDIEQSRDWYRLCRGAMAYLKANDQSEFSLSFINRKRIRHLLEPIASIVEIDQQRSGKEPRGRRTTCFEFNGEWSLSSNNIDVDVVSIHRAELPSSPFDSFDEGCRVPRYRSCTVPSFMPNGGEIRVSTVRIGARTFISGISHHLAGDLKGGPAVGYGKPMHEESIKVPPGGKTQWIKVALCLEGLRGIRFHFSGEFSSDCIGDHDDEDMAHGSLAIPMSPSNRYNLIAGSDKYKLNVIGTAWAEKAEDIIDETNRNPQVQTDVETLRRQMRGPHMYRPESHLWATEQPAHEHLFLGDLQPSSANMTFQPLFDIDFGGKNGEKLERLTEMVVHMSSDGRIIGMTFYDTDRVMAAHSPGRHGGIHLAFLIDGPGGERITQAVAATDNLFADYFQGLRVFTNYGRKMDFGTVQLWHFSELHSKRLQNMRGSIITGFVTTKHSNDAHLSKIGVQVQLGSDSDTPPAVCRDQPIRYMPHKDKCLFRRMAALIHDEGLKEYDSYASLHAVSQIQVSTGGPEKCRGSSRISGMVFDYHNGRSPEIVGQHMEEGDAMELSEGEHVQAITFWLSKESGVDPMYMRGQVVAVLVETTHAQSKMFGSHPALQECTKRKFQATSKEVLGGISWIFNTSYDAIRGVIFPSHSKAHL
ncbi:hypothetical protein MW887_004814 [Aspergillus wentii]|nr:hypothetical protein MW887_004814 [Aspergillus wentii]